MYFDGLYCIIILQCTVKKKPKIFSISSLDDSKFLTDESLLLKQAVIVATIFFYADVQMSMCSGSLSPRHGASSGCG